MSYPGPLHGKVSYPWGLLEEKIDMTNYSTYGDYEGMRPCMKKPVVVHAMQINEHFSVNSREGSVLGEPGDYLMKGIEGEHYICNKDIFEKSYGWVEDDHSKD